VCPWGAASQSVRPWERGGCGHRRGCRRRRGNTDAVEIYHWWLQAAPGRPRPPGPALHIAVAHEVAASTYRGVLPSSLLQMPVGPVDAVAPPRTFAEAGLAGIVAAVVLYLAHGCPLSTLLVDNPEARAEQHLQAGDLILLELHTFGEHAVIAEANDQPDAGRAIRPGPRGEQ